MNSTITIENGLAAYFKQAAGPSRPGVDWAIRISGERAGMAMVRTYFSSDPPQESERQMLADKAIRLIQQKLAEGWVPQGEVLEVGV